MIKAVFNNRGLLKVSVNFRLPEGRHKIDQATMRNQEIREFDDDVLKTGHQHFDLFRPRFETTSSRRGEEGGARSAPIKTAGCGDRRADCRADQVRADQA